MYLLRIVHVFFCGANNATMQTEEYFQFICPEQMIGTGYLSLVTKPQKLSLNSRPIFFSFLSEIVTDSSTFERRKERKKEKKTRLYMNSRFKLHNGLCVFL